MALQDVSHDTSMIDWLRQAGHGHLLGQQNQLSSNIPRATSPPIIPSGRITVDPYPNSFNRSAPVSQVGNVNFQSYNRQSSPIPSPTQFSAPQMASPIPFSSPQITSPTQFLAPHMNQPHYDAEIENMRHDPNTRIVQRPPEGDVVYKQRVFVRYLQPPTPPVGGTIIVREKQAPPLPPDPPLVIRRPPPPPPPTPPPVVIREHPPPMPPPEGTTVIDKLVPPGPKPPPQVIIEQYPPLPPKPPNVIIERWLPPKPRQRQIFYERLPAPAFNQQAPGRQIVVQHGQPNVHVQRQVIGGPMSQYPLHHASGHTDINQVLSQFGVNQQIHSTLSPSSLISYNPHTTCQQTCSHSGCQKTCCTVCQPQSNVIVMKSVQPNIISSSCYGQPLSCVCKSNSMVGLGAYGSCISTVPTMCHSTRQSAVYSVPENLPIDNVLRQFGIDPCCIRQPMSICNPSSNMITCATSCC